MALTNMGLKDQNWSHFEGEQIVKEKEKRKREKRKREKKRRRGRGDQAKRYGTNLGYEFLYEFPYNCMIISCTQT